ncbi:UTRA domain-containing protein [Streptomyces sp. NPDC060028]|uniref:UTRA domain-containing protein n=1 Tax=Streptomyces sp. NPDC060028 TaxID=3347041 RepID=UPI0036C90FE8
MAQITGKPITHRIDTVAARLLTPEDAELLELDTAKPPREPVIVTMAKFVNSAGDLVEYGATEARV